MGIKSDPKTEPEGKKMTSHSVYFFDSENSKRSKNLDPETGTLRPAFE